LDISMDFFIAFSVYFDFSFPVVMLFILYRFSRRKEVEIKKKNNLLYGPQRNPIILKNSFAAKFITIIYLICFQIFIFGLLGYYIDWFGSYGLDNFIDIWWALVYFIIITSPWIVVFSIFSYFIFVTNLGIHRASLLRRNLLIKWDEINRLYIGLTHLRGIGCHIYTDSSMLFISCELDGYKIVKNSKKIFDFEQFIQEKIPKYLVEVRPYPKVAYDNNN